LLWDVNHLYVWIEALESLFVGSNDMSSKVKAFLGIFIISSLDIGGLGLLESLLGGNNSGSNLFTSGESNVGFVILELNVLIVNPWESFVEDVSGGLEISSSSNCVLVRSGSGSIGGVVRFNAGSVSCFSSLLFGDNISGGSLGWDETFVGLSEWVLVRHLNVSVSFEVSSKTSPLFSSWVNIILSIVTLGLSISGKSNVGLQSISSIGVGRVSRGNISSFGGLESLLIGNNLGSGDLRWNKSTVGFSERISLFTSLSEGVGSIEGLNVTLSDVILLSISGIGVIIEVFGNHSVVLTLESLLLGNNSP